MSAFTDKVKELGALEPSEGEEDVLAMVRLFNALGEWTRRAHLRALTEPELKGRDNLLRINPELLNFELGHVQAERWRISKELERRQLGGGLLPEGWNP